LPKKKTPTASNDPNISFKTFDASYVLTNKSGKVVAKYVGGQTQGLQDLCLGTQGAASGGSSWIIDSGCTNHMTGEKRMFSSYEKNEDPQRAITFGDGN
jgi:hypothetical protein